MRIVADFKAGHGGDVGGVVAEATSGGPTVRHAAASAEVGVQVDDEVGTRLDAVEAIRKERERLEAALHALTAMQNTLATDAAYVAVYVAAQCAASAASAAGVAGMQATAIPYSNFIAHLEAQQEEVATRRRARHAATHRVLAL